MPLPRMSKNVQAGGGKAVNSCVGFPTNDDSASHSLCILIGQMQWKPSENCPKNAKKLSKTNTKLKSVGHGLMCVTVKAFIL